MRIPEPTQDAVADAKHEGRPSVALFVTIGGLVLVAMLAGVVGIFWTVAHPKPVSVKDAKAQSFENSGYSSEGGHNAIMRPKDTKAELRFRGF
jgi:flagellar basal body-associated protein FliL